jgi:hypothetical protein
VCAAIVLVGLTGVPRTAEAQARPSEQRIDELLRGAYNPASSFEQLLDCHYRALTQGVRLDSERERTVRQVIAHFRRRPGPPARAPEWKVRLAARDSAILSVLPSRADSAQYARNANAEQRWFEAGNCNGPTIRRP